MLAWTWALHVPFRAVEGSDDAFFLEIAHLWSQGVLPYIGAFDIKPPGLFAILVAAESALGVGLQTIHAVSIAFDAVAATALYFLGRRLGSDAIGVASALLYPFLSLFVTNNSAYPPLGAFTILAFLAALSPLPIARRALLAGLSIGLASTIKQTAAFEGVALLAVFWRAPDAGRQRMKTAWLFAGAACLAPLVILLYFAAHGAAGALAQDVVANALLRPGSAIERVSFAEGVLRFFVYLTKPIEPLLVLACLAFLRRRVILAAAPDAPIDALFLWSAAAILSAWAQHALFRAYLAPAFAPLALLANAVIVLAVPELKRIGAPLRTVAVAVLTVASVLLVWKPDLDRVQDSEAIATAAQAIRATDPSPQDKLFVAGHGLSLYVATGLAPPTAYFHWEHTLCDFPGAGLARLAEALAAEPRYIVASARMRYRYERPESWKLVDAALSRSYRLIAHIPAKADFYDIYELVEARSADFGRDEM
ncbi:MAG TPA: glycosyltransferase family 39 protein [Roseiarcus sp.]|nr:glycosyltransferase family 39 protein [Roseiarcus sp.]